MTFTVERERDVLARKIEEKLDEWKRHHDALIGAFSSLNKLTGATPDCALMRPIFDVWSAYTASVSELIGDQDQWLDWYQFECDMGEKPQKAYFNGKETQVLTISDLAQVILDYAIEI